MGDDTSEQSIRYVGKDKAQGPDCSWQQGHCGSARQCIDISRATTGRSASDVSRFQPWRSISTRKFVSQACKSVFGRIVLKTTASVRSFVARHTYLFESTREFREG